jgi:hypothetical protein
MASTLKKTGVWIEFSELTEDEYTRLMDLCSDVAIRQAVEAGDIEMKDDVIRLTEKGKARRAFR